MTHPIVKARKITETRHMSYIAETADTFEKWGRDYQAIANKTDNVASRAAILKEAAHYFECAERLRGAVTSQTRQSEAG